MSSTTEEPAAPAATPKPVRRRPYVDPPPLLQLVTVEQFEAEHPALAGRMRQWIHKADSSHIEFVGLRRAIVRVGRSLMVNRLAANEWLSQRAAMPPAASRRSRGA